MNYLITVVEPDQERVVAKATTYENAIEAVRLHMMTSTTIALQENNFPYDIRQVLEDMVETVPEMHITADDNGMVLFNGETSLNAYYTIKRAQ